eukprot:TRINITY_DN42373_c0_g1_i1.p1 TRINITY_DN42373_c0_g1~~TRINITY_DN42373_c0_g1_i1.p1  ORF type:complete len:257 (+),score=29.28 TRINITY_DN42373_c0_g1_i1:65-835(+)
MVSHNFVVLTRVLGISFWIAVSAFGIYWVLTVFNGRAGSFRAGLRDLSTGLLLLIVALEGTVTEMREALQGPLLREEGTEEDQRYRLCRCLLRHRLQQLLRACMYFVVGCFLVTPSMESDMPSVLKDLLGWCFCVAGVVMAMLRIVLMLSPYVPPQVQGGSQNASPQTSFRQSSNAARDAAPVDTGGRVEPLLRQASRTSVDRAEEVVVASNSSALSGDDARGDEEDPTPQRSRAGSNSNGLAPDVAMWNPSDTRS